MKRPDTARLRRLARAALAPRRTIPACAAAALALVLMLAWPMDTRPYLQLSASSELLDREGRPLYAFLNDGEQGVCGPWRDEPASIHATLAPKTSGFTSIRVDRWPSCERSTNLRGGEVVSGAST